MLKKRPKRMSDDRKRQSIMDNKGQKLSIGEQTNKIIFEIIRKYGEQYRPKQEELLKLKREREKKGHIISRFSQLSKKKEKYDKKKIQELLDSMSLSILCF